MSGYTNYTPGDGMDVLAAALNGRVRPRSVPTAFRQQAGIIGVGLPGTLGDLVNPEEAPVPLPDQVADLQDRVTALEDMHVPGEAGHGHADQVRLPNNPNYAEGDGTWND